MGKIAGKWKRSVKKERNTFCQNNKVPLPEVVPMRLPFRDLLAIKNPGKVFVPVEHDAAELLVW